ncbi:MAG: hypothetical protein CMR00_04975 [[Chlorobium] sp. 445]|nr:MAG: hypothetical protein CMR00_04975 [[Chlorobium] sp. 445]
MKKIVIFTLLSLYIAFPLLAQSKKPITHDVYDSWKSISGHTISNNGKYAAYSLTPQEGDATLMIHTLPSKDSKAIERGENAQFSADSEFLVFKIKPQLDSVKAQKRRKVRAENLPKDSLGIYALQIGELIKIARVKSFKMPEKAGGWLAYQHEKNSLTRKTLPVQKADAQKKKMIPWAPSLCCVILKQAKRYALRLLRNMNLQSTVSASSSPRPVMTPFFKQASIPLIWKQNACNRSFVLKLDTKDLRSMNKANKPRF